MLTIAEHFNQDFSTHKTETLPSPTTVTFGQHGREVQVWVQYHHNSRLRQSFMSVLRPDDLASAEIDHFYRVSIPQLRQRCIKESKVSNFPVHQPSPDVYVYTGAAHIEGIEQVGELRIIKRGPNYATQMENLTNLIDSFALSYKLEQREWYKQVTQHARTLVEAALKERNILAIVSHREKDPLRLKQKLWQRAIPIEDPEARYSQNIDIVNDLVDLAGVRVALYFPGDRERTVEALTCILPEHKEMKNFLKDNEKNQERCVLPVIEPPIC